MFKGGGLWAGLYADSSHACDVADREGMARTIAKPPTSSLTAKPHFELPDSLTLPIKEFIGYCKVECGFSDLTIYAYSADLRDFAEWLSIREVSTWDAVTLDVIGVYLRWLSETSKMATSSIARHVATMRVFFRNLHALGAIPTDPAPRNNRHLKRP